MKLLIELLVLLAFYSVAILATDCPNSAPSSKGFDPCSCGTCVGTITESAVTADTVTYTVPAGSCISNFVLLLPSCVSATLLSSTCGSDTTGVQGSGGSCNYPSGGGSHYFKVDKLSSTTSTCTFTIQYTKGSGSASIIYGDGTAYIHGGSAGGSSPCTTCTFHNVPTGCVPCDCTSGDCCDLATCLFKDQTQECRPATGSCDVAENCSGSSAACPEDKVKDKGTQCGSCPGPQTIVADGKICDCPDDTLARRWWNRL
jgi:hypothetical protein